MRRRRETFDRQSAAFSVVFHLSLILLAWVGTLYDPPPMEFITYEIELVSPPPTQRAEEAAPAVEEMTVERPDPTPPEPQELEPEPEETVTVERDDPPEDPPAPEPEPVTEVADDPTPATTTREPTEDARESGEDINVRMEGIRRDYPVYYNNIIRQILNCFRPPREARREVTVIFFYIERDGTVKEMDFTSRSGNVEFDFSAMGAVECAGGGRFGPLPEDLPYDRLPIQFTFEPRGELRVVIPAHGRPALDEPR